MVRIYFLWLKYRGQTRNKENLNKYMVINWKKLSRLTMSKNSETYTTNHLHTNIEVIRLGGILAEGNIFSLINIAIRIFLSISGFLHFTLFTIRNESNSILDKIESIHWIVFYNLANSWMFTMLYGSRTFMKIHYAIKSGIYEYSDGLTEEQIIIREQANKNVVKCNDILNIMYGSALVVSLIKGLFFNNSQDKWAPMYPGWWPVEINTAARYIILCIYHISISISTVSMGSSFFKTYVAIGCQILGQLDILTVTIKDAFTKENATDVYIRNRIKAIVDHHNAIYKIFKEYHHLFHFSFLWGAMCQELLLCTLAYLVTDPESTLVSISSFTLIMAGELTITLLGCQLGEYIIQKGNKIEETLYNINWYERTPKIRKDIFIIMLRCNKPIQVKAGGIMVYCREGFKDIIQASYTYFNMLNATRN